MNPLTWKTETVTKSVYRMTDKVKSQRLNQNYKPSLGFKVQNMYYRGGLSSIKTLSVFNCIRRYSQGYLPCGFTCVLTPA